MADIFARKIDEVWMHVSSSDRGIEMELHEKFKFLVDGYKFMPAFRAGTFDGHIRLYNPRTKRLYIGLLSQLKQVANDLGYEVDSDIRPKSVSEKNLREWLQAQIISVHGKLVEVRDYQIESVVQCILNQRQLLLSPTSCLSPLEEIEVELTATDAKLLQKIRSNNSNNVVDR